MFPSSVENQGAEGLASPLTNYYNFADSYNLGEIVDSAFSNSNEIYIESNGQTSSDSTVNNDLQQKREVQVFSSESSTSSESFNRNLAHNNDSRVTKDLDLSDFTQHFSPIWTFKAPPRNYNIMMNPFIVFQQSYPSNIVASSQSSTEDSGKGKSSDFSIDTGSESVNVAGASLKSSENAHKSKEALRPHLPKKFNETIEAAKKNVNSFEISGQRDQSDHTFKFSPFKKTLLNTVFL